MGPWVGMDFDDQGRLIVGSHNSAQAYRLTLPAIGSNEALQIESLGNNIGYGHSVLSAFDSLYFMVGDEQNATRRTSGLYRATDTNGDDTFDSVQVLRNLRGWGQHGTHGDREPEEHTEATRHHAAPQARGERELEDHVRHGRHEDEAPTRVVRDHLRGDQA